MAPNTGTNRPFAAEADNWTLAIDFGTSNTVTVVNDRLGTRPVGFPTGTEFFPSVVFVDDDGQLISGISAFNNRLIHPRRYYADVKKSINEGHHNIPLAGKTYPIVELVAAVLREAKRAAMQFRLNPQQQPAHTALTHPVAWGDEEIAILRDAAQLAELPAVTTFQEPVAAAYRLYHDRFQRGEYIVVYDLGGGTFDVALLQRTADAMATPGGPLPTPYRVVNTEGSKKIGGEFFDDKIWEFLDSSSDLHDAPPWAALQVENCLDHNDERPYRDWLVGRRQLRESITHAKIDLSSQPQSAIFIPHAVFPHAITRDQFEAVLLPDLNATVDMVTTLLRRNHLASNNIAHVALVGGSSQIPKVRQLLIERGQFNDNQVGTPALAQTVVALGAAALVELREPESDAEKAFRAGEAWEVQSGWNQAADNYQYAVDCEDTTWSPHAAYQLGQLRTQHPERTLFRKSYDTAINAYRIAMRYRDSEWAARSALELGNFMLQNNRLDEAAVAFENAMRANYPEVSPQAAFQLGLLHLSRGEWESTEDAWQTAIDHGHSDWSPLAAYHLGADRKMRKNHAGARDAWLRAMNDFKHPEWSPQAALRLGELLREKGRKAWPLAEKDYQEEMRGAYQHAIDSGHQECSPQAAYALGRVCEKRRDWQGAEAAYQKAIASGGSEWATKAIQRKSAIRKHL
jgi:tetratricopeptide (TPR) repeat protein